MQGVVPAVARVPVIVSADLFYPPAPASAVDVRG